MSDELKPVTEFTIDRRHWYRGKGAFYSQLKLATGVATGKMCCLGFFCEASGVPVCHLEGISSPSRLVTLFPQYRSVVQPLLHVYDDVLISNRLMEVNDDANTNREREQQLTDIFKSIGVTVHFEN